MTGKSLNEYIRDARKANCVICNKVPQELIDQIKDSYRKKGVTVETALQWLRKEHGFNVTPEQWALHARGQHKRTSK